MTYNSEMGLSGSQNFIENLLKRYFLSSNEVVSIMNGCEVNGHNLSMSGFLKPIVVGQKEGLRIQVPPSSFSPRDLLLHIDPLMTVDVIDVRNQCEIQMQLSDFINHFMAKNRKTLLNMLSLEFSKSRLAKYVQPPHVVSELSLVTKCWIHDDICDVDVSDTDDNCIGEFQLPPSAPTVQKYCLLSMQGSYTDFHIDFGGSSVWYHILWGEKIFYLIPPTPDHFTAYWQWSRSSNQREVFLPDLLIPRKLSGDQESPPVYSLHIKPGETVLLPSGWIHAVYTSSDCLVFGGNFLCELHIPMQLSVYRQEEKSDVPEKFRFPNFEKIHWFVAENLIGRLTNALYDGLDAKPHELIAASHLSKVLRRWYEKRRQLPISDRNYYLPSRSTLELAWPDLVQRIADLVQAFKPTESPKRADTTPAVKSDSRQTPIAKKSVSCGWLRHGTDHSMSSEKKYSNTEDDDWLPPKKSRTQLRRTSVLRSTTPGQTDAAAIQDQDVLLAVPELAHSRLVGDHYFLDLMDTDDQDSGGDLDEVSSDRPYRSSSQLKASRGIKDDDPTWIESPDAQRKGGGHGKRRHIDLTSSTKTSVCLPKACLASSGELHPLLQRSQVDTKPTVLQAPSSSSTGPSRVNSPPHGSGRGGRKSSASSTVRQRLAKRLGIM